MTPANAVRLVVALGVLYVLAGLRGPAAPAEVRRFAVLPVLHGGRIKPFDTVARNTLLQLKGKQRVERDGRTLAPAEWLLDLFADPAAADAVPVFRIDNPDVLSLVHQAKADKKFFTFKELEPTLRVVASQAERAEAVESVLRSPFQRAVLQLARGAALYQRLKNTFQLTGTPDLPAEIAEFEAMIPAGLEAVHAQTSDRAFDPMALALLSAYFQKYSFLAENAALRPMPDAEEFLSMGEILRRRLRGGEFHPSTLPFAEMMKARLDGDVEAFADALARHEAVVERLAPRAGRLARHEELFNRVQPLYRAIVLYLAALLLAFASWMRRPKPFGPAAFALLGVAFAVHTAGLLTRMVLEGRPPVTNLYSSAVFVGWACAALALFLERMRRGGIGTAAGAMTGFASLIVAHHLTGDGDTMEMMRAVLDSNFWLGTHVVTITIGYSATYLAGFLATIYLVRGALTRSLDKAAASDLVSMVYGVVCFATLFSFVGTVLGGIWADQSWGRFWGWDPKENGALLIVVWNAIILHARWGGMIRERGLMVLAVFGNVITTLSWFGVNMLGIGLHSYGFMDKALYAIVLFALSQFGVMALGLRLRSPR